MNTMNKEYTVNDFTFNEYAWKPITDEGRRSSYSGKYDINYSSILTRLIQEAGRYCERFASDLFIDWQSVTEWIDGAEPGQEKTFLFGFRENGVDHDAFILSRFNSYCCPEKEYRSIWRLDISTDYDDRITMTLGRVC